MDYEQILSVDSDYIILHNNLRYKKFCMGYGVLNMAKELLLNGKIVPKSTIPDEWLQPLVAEKVAELNQKAMKDFVTIEKKVFDTLQKNNLDLMAELNKARLALATVYEIVDRVYNWEYDYDICELYGKDLQELAHVIKEYEQKNGKTECPELEEP